MMPHLIRFLLSNPKLKAREKVCTPWDLCSPAVSSKCGCLCIHFTGYLCHHQLAQPHLHLSM